MQVVHILMAKMSKCPSIVLQVECNRISNQLAYTTFLIFERNVQLKSFRSTGISSNLKEPIFTFSNRTTCVCQHH